MSDHHPENYRKARAFPLTRWSLIQVLQAPPVDETQRIAAKNEICRSYWSPLYQLGVNLGLTPQDAEDATQNFFVRLMQGELWNKADGTKGKLRSFLAAAYRRHIIDTWRHQSAQKRGGMNQAGHESIDNIAVEEMSQPMDHIHLSFERDWARSLVTQALQRLDDFYAQRGKSEIYQALVPFLGLDAQDAASLPSLQSLESITGLSGSSLRMALLRLRERFRHELLTIVADTLPHPSADEAMAELREILAIMQSQPRA